MLPLQAIDLTTRSNPPGAWLLAIVVLAMMFGGQVLIRWRTGYWWLPSGLRGAKSALHTERASADFRTYRLPLAEDLAAEDREHIRALFGNSPPDEATTVDDATNAIRNAIRQTVRPIVEAVPPLAIRVASLAVATFILGMVTASTAAVVALLQRPVGPIRFGEAAGSTVETIEAVATAGIDTLFLFPFLGTLWSLAFAYSAQLWQWAWVHYGTVAGVLLAGAIAVAVLDYLTPRVIRQEAVAGGRRRVVAQVLAVLGAVWVAGVLPSAGLARAGYPQLGGFLGFATAIAVTVVALARGLRGGWAALRAYHDRWRSAIGADWWGWAVAGYLLARRVAATLAVLVVPVVLAYALFGIAEGRIGRVLGALATAPPAKQAVVGLWVLLGIAGAGWVLAPAWEDTRAALADLAAKESTRVTLYRQGAPAAVVLVVGLVVFSLFGGGGVVALLAGCGAGLTAGLVAQQAIYLGRRARSEVELFGRDRGQTGRVYLEVAAFETPEGQQWYARVDGDTELLHPDPREVEAAIIAVAEGVADDGEPPPTVPEWHARWGFRYGIADIEETYRKLHTRIGKAARQVAREHGGAVSREGFDERLAEYPPEMVAWWRTGERPRVVPDDIRDEWKGARWYGWQIGEETVELRDDIQRRVGQRAASQRAV